MSAGARPNPMTITRYTATTTAVSPVADTVCTSTRSTRRETRGLAPRPGRAGSARWRPRDLRGVRGPVHEDPQRSDDQGHLGDDGHRAADELQSLAGQPSRAEVGLVGGGEADQERGHHGCGDGRNRWDSVGGTHRATPLATATT